MPLETLQGRSPALRLEGSPFERIILRLKARKMSPYCLLGRTQTMSQFYLDNTTS